MSMEDINDLNKSLDEISESIHKTSEEIKRINKEIEELSISNNQLVPRPCRSCPSHPSNGGSGICHCILGCPTIT